MERIPCSANENAGWTLQQQQPPGESIRELKYLLFSTSLELERTRANAEMQKQRQDARLRELQEVVGSILRERDEARQQLQQLSQSLAEYSTLTNTQRHVMSSERPQWPETRLAAAEPEELNPTTAAAVAAAIHSISSPLAGPADQFRCNSGSFQPQNPSSRFHFSNPADLHQPLNPSSRFHFSCESQDEPFYHHNEQRLNLVNLQESEQRQHRIESHLRHLVQDKSTEYDLRRPQQQEAAVTGSSQPSSSSLFLEVAEPTSAGGHMTCHDPKQDLILPSPSPILDSPPAHLPEPPESDLEVMLKNLPERGKLLPAVMKAGPLLKTLLMAGPLPKWIHPPNSMENPPIPKISLCASPNSLPMPPMVPYLPNPQSPTTSLDPLQVNPSGHSLSPPTIIEEPPIAVPFITSLQSGSGAAMTSSKGLRTVNLSSQDSAIAACVPLNFANIH